MSLNLVQWEGSTVTPKLDAIMYDDASYGIIKGCSITHQGTNLLKIAAGYIKIAGRLIEVTEETISCQVSSSGTVNGQLWLRLDLGSVTPVQFMSEAAAVLTPLTQETDCNFTNGVYELQLATYDVDESVISNLDETAPTLTGIRGAIDDLEGDVSLINSNLSGFKYYPIGTTIVGLVADDTPYTNDDGNYILADSATGRGLIDNITYKSISSTEKTYGEVGADTCSPFSKELELEQDLLLSNTGGSGISSYTEFSLNGKLSDYRYIKIKALNYNLASSADMNAFVSNNYIREKTVKVSDFINGSIAYVYFDTTNTSYYATVTYVDDEHIGVNRSGNSKPSISIFGMN